MNLDEQYYDILENLFKLGDHHVIEFIIKDKNLDTD